MVATGIIPTAEDVNLAVVNTFDPSAKEVLVEHSLESPGTGQQAGSDRQAAHLHKVSTKA